MRTEMIEPLRRGLSPTLGAAVDVADRCSRFAREPRAGVDRSIGADRVRILSMDFARPHVDAIRRRKAAPPRFVAEIRHLLVDEMARIAHAAADTRQLAGAGARHAGTVERLAVAAHNRERDDPFRSGGAFDDRLEVDLRDLIGELLLFQEVEQVWIAVD